MDSRGVPELAFLESFGSHSGRVIFRKDFVGCKPTKSSALAPGHETVMVD
jgi:hypothetical protein